MIKHDGKITTQNLVPAGVATAGSAVELLNLTDEGSVTVQVTGTYTGALTPQGRVNGLNWVDLFGLTNVTTGTTVATIASGTAGVFRVDASGIEAFRLSANGAVTGTATVAVRAGQAAAAVTDVSVSLENSDVQIGAVEIKNATTDDRMTVAADGRAATDANLQVGNVDSPGGAGAVTASTQRMTLASDDPAVSSLNTMDDWDESDRAKVNPIVGQAGVQGGSGVVTALTQRVVLATDVALPAGTNAIGTVTAVGPAADGAAVSGNPVRIAGKDGSGNTQDVATDTAGRPEVNTISGQTGVQGGAGAVSASTQRVAIATDANTVDTELTTADLDTGAGTDTRAVVGLVRAESGGGVLVGSANPMPADLRQVAGSVVVASAAGVQKVGIASGATGNSFLEATAANLGAQSALGASIATGPGQWSVKDEPAADTVAVATKAAGGAQVRHVCTSILATIEGTATAVSTVQLKDGSTVVYAGRLRCAANDGNVLALSDLNIIGTANTAMSLEVSDPANAGVFVTASLSGYSTL